MPESQPSPVTGTSPTTARISRGAVTLLAIAQENDKYKKIADNEALRSALAFFAQLPDLCSRQNKKDLLTKLDISNLPAAWFNFCVAAVNALDVGIERRVDGKSENWSLRTDFDRNVYLAVGQSIGEIVGAHRKSLDFPTGELLGSLAKVPPVHLQELLIKNYIGNILQELFDSCKVRLKKRGLAEDTELNLRKEDAHKLAAALFAQQLRNRSAIDIEGLLQSLKSTLESLKNSLAQAR